MKAFLNKLRYNTGHRAILVRGAIGSFVVKIFAVAIAFALHILLARLLGANQYGIYVYTLTCVNIMVILSMLGLNNSLVLLAAAYKAQQKWDMLRGIFRRSTQTVITVSVLIGLIGGIVVWCIRDHISSDQTITFYIALTALPILTLAKLQEVGLRSIKSVIKSGLLLGVIHPLLVAAMVCIFFFCLRRSIFANQVMIVTFIAAVITFSTGRLWVARALPDSVRETRPVYADRIWLKMSLPLLLIDGAYLLLSRVDMIMIGAILGTKEAGIYAAASRIVILVTLGLLAANTIIAPLIAELYSTGNIKDLQRIVILAARGTFVFTLVACVGLGITGKYILALFGQSFIVAFFPLLILLTGRLISTLSGPVEYLMVMTRYQAMAGLIMVISLAVNIAMNSLLIPTMGLTGAAIATAFTTILWNITMLLYVRRKLGINPTIIPV